MSAEAVASKMSVGDQAGYQLHSELFRSCLPQANDDPGRKLIWINTICAGFVAIGILGIRKPLPLVIHAAEVEEHVTQVEVFQPPPPPPPEQVPTDKEPPPETEFAPAPTVAVIALDDPSKALFAVPVQGVTIVTNNVAKVSPPPRKYVQPAPVNTGPVLFRRTGTSDGGYYPDPEYPHEAILNHESGTVEIHWQVNEDGSVANAEVLSSSGHPLLDRTALSTLKRRWRFPAGSKRDYQYQFEFQLQ